MKYCLPVLLRKNNHTLVLMTAFLIFKLLIYCGLLGFISYFFVYKIILKFMERRRLRLHGIETQATVVDYKVMRDSSGASRYYPILEFSTRSNKVIRLQSNKERYQKYDVGKQMTIYYREEQPESIYITGLFPYIKITSLVLGISASALILFEIFKMIRKML